MSFIDKNWKEMLNEKFKEKSRDEIWKKIRKDILDKFPDTQFQPEEKNIFNVFEMLRSEIKVVILGQDPYPTPGDAMGYAFAVKKEIKEIPKSLKLIKNVIEEKFGLANYSEPWQTLKHWRDSGVFLLNTALTIGKNKDSHLGFWRNFTKRKKGFTNKVIEYISETSEKYPCIWMLWGREAKKFKETIKKINDKNYILEAPHPAVRDNSFCECVYYNFLDANKILNELYEKGIEW